MQKDTKESLMDAGWYQEREFDISPYKSANIKHGHTPYNEATEQFLRSFGGLTLGAPRGRFHFNAKKASKTLFPEDVKEYEERLGVALSVIGEADNGCYTLMMAPTGVVYGAFDELLILVGMSGEEAIERLHQGRDHKVIYSGFSKNDANPPPKRAYLGG